MATLSITSQTIIFLFGLVLSATAYSKYGRTCQDIGCLPSEVCAMAQDSCSWSQRDGKDCGNYPTCKKSGSTASSPGAGTPSLPSVPSPSTSHRDPNTNLNSQTGFGDANNSGGNLYPRIPASAPPAPPSAGVFGSNVNTGGYTPPSYPSAPSNYPSAPANYPSAPANYPSAPSSYPSAPSGYGGNRDDNRNNNPYPNPYGNRDPNANRDRDNGHRGGSSSSDDSSGFGSLLNIFSRGGGNTDRYGSGGSGGSSSSSGGLDYGSIFNAISGGNRGGSSSGNSGSNGLSGILSSFGSGGGGSGLNRNSDSSGLSGILSSFGGGGGSSPNTGSNGLSGILSSFGGSGGNHGSGVQDRFGGSANTNIDNRRQQPSPAQDSNGSGFLSSLSSLFGQQIGNTLIQGALSGNRGQNDGASGILNSIQNRRYGGLFTENTGHAAGSPTNNNSPRVPVSGAGPGGYPTQAPIYPRQTPAQAYPNADASNRRSYTNSMSAMPSSSAPNNQNQKPLPYGWSVGQH